VAVTEADAEVGAAGEPRRRPNVRPAQAIAAAFPKASAAMSARHELGEVFSDEQSAVAFGTRGAPAESPGALGLVTALQYTENLTGRYAGQAVAERIPWKYALAMELSEEGFVASALAEFRWRLVEHGCVNPAGLNDALAA
jgi:transposase